MKRTVLGGCLALAACSSSATPPDERAGSATDSGVPTVEPVVTEAVDAPPTEPATVTSTSTTIVPTTTPTTMSPTSVAASQPSPPPLSDTVAPSSSAGSVVPVTDPPVVGAAGAGGGEFCAPYGLLVTSTYLVGFSEAFSDDSRRPRLLELAAAETIRIALDEATAAVRSVAGGDAEAFAARWRRYGERADEALAALPAQAELTSAWRELVATHDRNDPDVRLPLAPAVQRAIDGAEPAFSSRVGPLAQDPAVLAAFAIGTPAVDEYVRITCPDVAELTAGDAV